MRTQTNINNETIHEETLLETKTKTKKKNISKRKTFSFNRKTKTRTETVLNEIINTGVSFKATKLQFQIHTTIILCVFFYSFFFYIKATRARIHRLPQ